jgi:hypothetical protein
LTDTSRKNTPEKHVIPDPIVEDAKFIMEFLSENFDTPPEALFAAIVAVAVLAKGAGMPSPVLLEGIAAAYDDLDPLALGVGAEVKHGHH